MTNNNKNRSEKYPLRYVARVVIEFKTPFLIGGEPSFYSESVFISDANGLPSIPGTSLAGILRHELSELLPNNESSKIINSLFGYQDRKDGCGSRLTISWGCIHDSDNIPVEGLLDEKQLSDPVLQQALYSLTRDHVLINHQGTAKKTGKFDEIRVSAGHRFTFEIMLEGNTDDEQNWEKLLEILLSDNIRIGGKSRRGYGAFTVVSIKQGKFNLSDKDEFKLFTEYPFQLSEPIPSNSPVRERCNEIEPKLSEDYITATIELEPEGFWMIGGGDDDEADMSPIKEPKINWPNSKGEVSDKMVLVPGSAVKGAIAHRVAYYCNILDKKFAEKQQPDDINDIVGSNNKAIKELFGYSKDKKDGRRGRVIINDIYIEDSDKNQKILNHVSIDRFTGGAKTKTGALFSEKPIFKNGSYKLELMIHKSDQDSVEIRNAFYLALRDLSEGLLAIGSGAGRGNGFFKAKDSIQWSDDGNWIGGNSK